MSATPDIVTLARRVGSHDDSLRAVSDTAVEIKIVVDRHTLQFGAIRRTLTRHDRVLHRLHGTTSNLQVRMRAVENRLDRLEVRMDALEVRMDALEHRMDALEHRMGNLEDRMANVEGMLVEVLRRLPDPGPA